VRKAEPDEPGREVLKHSISTEAFGAQEQVWQVWQAIRAPLVLGVVWWALTRESALRTLIIIQGQQNPFHRFFCAPVHTFFRLTPMQHDCFMYLPISLWSVEHQLWLVGYAAGLIIGLTVWTLLRDDKSPTRLGWKAWLLTAILAAWPWVTVLEGPRVRLLPIFVILTVLTWCFIVLNLKAATARAAIAHKPWLRSLAEWTFPISDLAWFTFHQRRMEKRHGWLRFVPILSVLIALAAVTVSQGGALQASAQLSPLPVRVFDPHQASCDADGCWFAETVGQAAGLWRYDTRSREATPVVRAQDLRSFVVAGRWLYVYDGFEREVLKIDPETHRPVWRVRVPSADAVEVVGDKDMVFAVALNGSVTGIDQDGRVRFQRAFTSRAWYPQALGGDRVAFVSPDTMEVRIVGVESSKDTVIPLPISDERRRGNATSSADIPLIVGTTYVERSQTLYIATLWGEILRYEFTARQWRSPIRRPPGIRLLAADGPHNLLFVYHHVGGYIDLLDLASGRRIERVAASVFGNALSVSPMLQVAMLSTRGPGNTSLPEPGGLYELRYEILAKSAVRHVGD
jgi:hypothetical protein